MCFDDGTGDNPVPRPYPGNASTDSVVEQSYVDYWRARTGNPALTYADLRCNPQHDVTRDDTYDTTPFQGAIGEHGIHFFMTGDTDNAGQQQQIDELDGQQWRFAVPTSGPRNVIQPYALVVLTPLQPAVTPFDVGGGSSAANAVADPGGVHPRSPWTSAAAPRPPSSRSSPRECSRAAAARPGDEHRHGDARRPRAHPRRASATVMRSAARRHASYGDPPPPAQQAAPLDPGTTSSTGRLRGR